MQIKTSKQLFEQLEKERISQNKSRYALASQTGLSRAAWTRMHSREGNMNTDSMFAIARELKLKVVLKK
jgi:DNA-binding phage protein